MFSRLTVLAFLLITGCSMPEIIILHDPLTVEEHLQLGLSYEKKGLIEEAKMHYKEAAKTDARGYLFLGNLYLTQGLYEEAEKSYRKAIKKDSNLADAYNNLAWLYCLKNENLEEAETLVKKAIEIEGNSDKIKIYENTLEEIRKLKTK